MVSFFFGHVTLETSDLVSFIKSLIFFNINSYIMAGVEGLEPATSGFGDRRSTNWATLLNKISILSNIVNKLKKIMEKKKEFFNFWIMI